MPEKYCIFFSICCLASFAQFIEADDSVAKGIGKYLIRSLKGCYGIENMNDSEAIKILTASDLKESDQCKIECLLEFNYVVNKRSQPYLLNIIDYANELQTVVPKPGVNLAQELINCDYKPKNKICFAGFKEYSCGRKVLEAYLGEGLFN